EVERVVLRDWAADAEAGLLVAELADLDVGRIRRRRRGDPRDRPDQALVAAEDVAGAADRIRAAPGHDVHAAAREAALADVIRRNDDLDFLDRVQADRLRAGLAARRAGVGETEQVVVDRPVDLHAVVTVVTARDRHRLVAAAPERRRVDERRRAGEVGDAPV